MINKEAVLAAKIRIWNEKDQAVCCHDVLTATQPLEFVGDSPEYAHAFEYVMHLSKNEWITIHSYHGDPEWNSRIEKEAAAVRPEEKQSDAFLIKHTQSHATRLFLEGSPRMATKQERMPFQGCDGELWVSNERKEYRFGKERNFQVMADLTDGGITFFVAYEDGSTRTWFNGKVMDTPAF